MTSAALKNTLRFADKGVTGLTLPPFCLLTTSNAEFTPMSLQILTYVRSSGPLSDALRCPLWQLGRQLAGPELLRTDSIDSTASACFLPLTPDFHVSLKGDGKFRESGGGTSRRTAAVARRAERQELSDNSDVTPRRRQLELSLFPFVFGLAAELVHHPALQDGGHGAAAGRTGARATTLWSLSSGSSAAARVSTVRRERAKSQALIAGPGAPA